MFETRIAAGRPVMTRDELRSLCTRILGMTSADVASVNVRHTARVITRVANGQMLTSDDGDELRIDISTRFGARAGAQIETNQLDDTTLRSAIERCEAIAREGMGYDIEILPERYVQDTFVQTRLWHESTVEAMQHVRATIVPQVLATVAKAKLRGSSFVGLMAQVDGVLSKDGLWGMNEETDSEVTVTARTLDGKSSGWAGQAERNWASVNGETIAAQAIDLALRGANPTAIEPGRRTAILGPAAVAQIMRFLGDELEAYSTDLGHTGFSRKPRGNKLRQRVFDPRIDIWSDPADPMGGYSPYILGGSAFTSPCATPAMSWIKQGVLENLQYDIFGAMEHGKQYSTHADSLHMQGGDESIEQMIARCDDGIYVNRFSSVDMLDQSTCMTTGVTRDGCFLVRHGKIDRPVKNFRFLESPFFFLNRLQGLGPAVRAAFGYTPPSPYERSASRTISWPRPPMVVPPLMVQDFNFNALNDAV